MSIQIGDLPTSLKLIKRAVELDPLSPVIRGEYAVSLAEAGDHPGAMREIDRMLRDNPRSPIAYGRRATLLAAQGDLVGALRDYEKLSEIDPDANAWRLNRCELLLDFGALEETETCLESSRLAASSSDFGDDTRVALLAARGDYAGALAADGKRARPQPWSRANLLTQLGRGEEAVKILQELDPGMFLQPEPKLTSSYAGDGLLAGHALILSGAEAQGRDLIRRQLDANKSKPIMQVRFQRNWSDAYGWALLGDHAKACAAIREAAAAGLVMNLNFLQNSPALATVRKQPCFEPAIAPARAGARAKLEAARAAGLL